MSALILASLLTLLGSKYAVAVEVALKRSSVHGRQDVDDIELARLSEEQGADVDGTFSDTSVAPWWRRQVANFLDLARKADPAPAAAPPAISDQSDMYGMCDQLCESDPEPDYCLTDCHTYVDNGGDVKDLEDFVTDSTYNEKGGKEMQKTFETMTGMDVASCKPVVDITKTPTFSQMDSNSDGVVSWPEANHFGIKMCIPDEMTYQIFIGADVNMDNEIDKKEFKYAGERTDIECALDMYLEDLVEGEDQYKRVQLPPFKEFDKDGDGLLDHRELMRVWAFEINRRVPMLGPTQMQQELKLIDARFLADFKKRIDTDHDGKISVAEYTRGAKEGGMGVEFAEAAAADEDMPDLDDASNPDPVLPTYPPEEGATEEAAPAPAPAPLMAAPPMFIRRRYADDEAEITFMRRRNVDDEAEITEELAGDVAELEQKKHKHRRHRHHHRNLQADAEITEELGGEVAELEQKKHKHRHRHHPRHHHQHKHRHSD